MTHTAGLLRAGLRGLKADIEVSSSHCIRLQLDDADAKRLMKRFRASLSKPYWADQERIERA